MEDQGICKSSWAFSTSGTVDGQLFVMTGNLVETSTQQLLDCSFSWGNRGCHGGIPSWTYRYIEEASGICEAQNYPYLGYVSLKTEHILLETIIITATIIIIIIIIIILIPIRRE